MNRYKFTDFVFIARIGLHSAPFFLFQRYLKVESITFVKKLPMKPAIHSSAYPAVVLFIVLIFLSCRKQDTTEDPPVTPQGPEMSGASVSGDNKMITLRFSKGIYKGGVLNQAVTSDDFLVQVEGGVATSDSFRVTHTAGHDSVVLRLYLKGLANGSERVTVKPNGAQAIVDNQAHPISETAQVVVQLADIGIIGSWVSTGENLSPVFQQFGFDSVYMQFRADGSYQFESFTTGGIHNYLTGTFVQTLSDTGSIRLIALSQQSPVSGTASGIFRLHDEAVARLVYEVVQTEPAVSGMTPPTPDLGFGSSGLLGSDNIQVFLKDASDR